MSGSYLDQLSDKEYRRRIRAWITYDWANSSFITTIVAAILPIYYSQVAGSTLSSAAKATQYWSLTLSISVLIVAVLSPILGTVSDVMAGKKKFLSFFVGVGVIGSGLLFFVDQGDWLMASIFFIIGRIGFGASTVFYDALLPHVAKDEDQDRVSAQGYAFGYLGGGILLVINVLMTIFIDGTLGVRLSFLSVGIWWLIFSVPIFAYLPEPPRGGEALKPGESLVRTSFSRIFNTIREIRQYRDLFMYLISFLIYNDGIGIVITVAAIYGAELGFATNDLIFALVLVQFLGIPYSLIFGSLAAEQNGENDKRQSRFLAFVIFNIVMLPLTALVGQYLLPQSVTGRPSPDFVAQGEFVGQGAHSISEVGDTRGDWTPVVISAADLGQGCAWYAFWCDEAAFSATYLQAVHSDARLDFPYNGQNVELTYSTGPDHGIWAVEIDGAPLLNEEGEPMMINAYRETTRYDVTEKFLTDGEGQHTLSLVNMVEADPASSGNVMSLRQVSVLQPLRTSNLVVIIIILFTLQVLGGLLAFLFGPALFSSMAERMNTKRAIMLALTAYAVVAVWGYFLSSVIEFWFLAWLIATVQGGSQALSRSLYAAMTPTSRSGEYFGFFSIMSKFASFLSPLVFVLSVALFDSSRPGVLSLIVFFGVGMYLLSKVDVERGIATAKAADAKA